MVSNINELDGAISIESISVMCDGSVQANVEFENTGSDDLNSVGFFVYANGDLQGFYTEDVEIAYGESTVVSVDVAGPFGAGENEFEVELTSVNGTTDIAPENASGNYFKPSLLLIS